MVKIESRANLTVNIVGLALILLSMVLKVLDWGTDFPKIYRVAVYLIFFTLWIVTITYRVVQRHIRNCLLIVGGLELFWVAARTLKYEVISSNSVNRYIWYLYYLPMLMIPAFCVLLSIYMGKPEGHRRKRSLIIFPLISAALFLLVVTNDLHGLVFVFRSGLDEIDVGDYGYGAGFFIVTVYITLCALASYGIILVKCRRSRGRFLRFLPIIPLSMAFIASAMNFCGIVRIFGIYQIDITMISCFCITATLESCIQSGLILTNNGYDELFRMSGTRVVITDRELKPLISSESYMEIPDELLREALDAPVITEKGFRLSCAEIRRGYVLWQDDISELSRVLTGLSETNDYLSDKSAAIQQAFDYQKKERRLIEKNRLYNRILTQTKPEIERYAALIDELDAERDPERARSLAIRTAFVSAFIKRRDNLIFLSEEDKLIDPSELSYCVEESLSNLRLGGAECSCSLTLGKPLGFYEISCLYEDFYRIIYAVIDDIESVCVYLTEEDGAPVISMRVSCGSGIIPDNGSGNVRTVKEDDEWVVTICAQS